MPESEAEPLESETQRIIRDLKRGPRRQTRASSLEAAKRRGIKAGQQGLTADACPYQAKRARDWRRSWLRGLKIGQKNLGKPSAN